MYCQRSNIHGIKKKFDYVQSRYFYCHWYAKLAVLSKEWAILKALYEFGYTLNIMGYDAPDIDDYTPSIIDNMYTSTDNPFGHELVLITMLTMPSSQWPWVLYKNNHPELYDDFGLDETTDIIAHSPLVNNHIPPIVSSVKINDLRKCNIYTFCRLGQ